MNSLIGQPKSFASLSSTLLARKGHARPAMRSQGYAGFGGASFGAGADAGDDLGWNDMGHGEPVTPVAVGPVPPVLRQREALRDELVGRDEPPAAPAVVVAEQAVPASSPVAAPASAPQPTAVRAAVGSKGKAAFTLRLDHARHLRLRLASAVANRSAQQIVTQALDAYLQSVPDLEQMVAQASTQADTKLDMGE